MRGTLQNLATFVSDKATQESKYRLLDRLDNACLLVERQPTQMAKELYDVGVHIQAILILLTEGRSSTVKESEVLEAVRMYKAAGLDPSSVEKVLFHVRVNQILRNVCDTMLNDPVPEKILEKVACVDVVDSLPKELIPWLRACDAYAQVLLSIENRDWLLIVNRCRHLEEIQERLAKQERGDHDNENMFLHLARKLCREGYKVALEMKAEDTQVHIEAVEENLFVEEVRHHLEHNYSFIVSFYLFLPSVLLLTLLSSLSRDL